MSRMSGPRRKELYQIIADRDTETCFIGGEEETSATLVLDHWDNNNSNNSLTNLHLLCRSMNSIKNGRGCDHRHKLQSSLYVCDKSNGEVHQELAIRHAEFKKNLTSEPAFKHWLFEMVVKNDGLEFEEVLNSGAAVAHCSQETIRRYLAKETSRVRLYMVEVDARTREKYVRLKPSWDNFRAVNEAKKKLAQQAKNWRDASERQPRTVKSKQTQSEQAELDLTPHAGQKTNMT